MQSQVACSIENSTWGSCDSESKSLREHSLGAFSGPAPSDKPLSSSKGSERKARLGSPSKRPAVWSYCNLHHSLFFHISLKRLSDITEEAKATGNIGGFHLGQDFPPSVQPASHGSCTSTMTSTCEVHFRWEPWLCPPQCRATYTAEPLYWLCCSDVSIPCVSSGSMGSDGRRDWNFSSCSGLARFFSRLFSRSSWLFFSASSLICSFKISTSSLTAYIRWFFTRSWAKSKRDDDLVFRHRHWIFFVEMQS